MEHRGVTPHTPEIHVDPGAVLPEGWDVRSDVLLIAGTGGTRVARPFRAHGTDRVVVYLPPNVPVADPDSGAAIVRSRQELARHLDLMGQPTIQRFATLRSPWCAQSRTQTDALFAAFDHLVRRTRSNQKVTDEFGPLWARNGIRNLPNLARWPMVSDLSGRLRGVPLIIVGAGPSLDKNIHLLRAAQGRAVILSVSRALRSLQSAGVTPDLAIVLEPQRVAYQFEGIDVANIRALALDATVNPELFNIEVPRLLGSCSNTHALNWMLDGIPSIEELSSGGSVSCSALSMGLTLGCDPIMLVGQDLSFSGGVYYASSGVDAKTRAVYDPDDQSYTLEGYSTEMGQAERMSLSGEAPRKTAATVPGYYGGTVPTSADFAHFRQWFENTALDHAGRVRLFNCTEGGAHIGGMVHRPLADVLAELPERKFDLDRVLDEVEVPDRATGFHRRVESMHDGLPLVIEQARRCIVLIDEACRAGRITERLERAEAALRETLRSVRVLNLLDQGVIRDVIQSAASAQTLQEALGYSRRLYALIVHEAPQLREPLREALDGFA